MAWIGQVKYLEVRGAGNAFQSQWDLSRIFTALRKRAREAPLRTSADLRPSSANQMGLLKPRGDLTNGENTEKPQIDEDSQFETVAGARLSHRGQAGWYEMLISI